MQCIRSFIESDTGIHEPDLVNRSLGAASWSFTAILILNPHKRIATCKQRPPTTGDSVAAEDDLPGLSTFFAFAVAARFMHLPTLQPSPLPLPHTNSQKPGRKSTPRGHLKIPAQFNSHTPNHLHDICKLQAAASLSLTLLPPANFHFQV